MRCREQPAHLWDDQDVGDQRPREHAAVVTAEHRKAGGNATQIEPAYPVRLVPQALDTIHSGQSEEHHQVVGKRHAGEPEQNRSGEENGRGRPERPLRIGRSPRYQIEECHVPDQRQRHHHA